MAGQKRDFRGKAKPDSSADEAARLHARNEFTPMFEHFRDELDEHHDRRESIVKASRDITALSKKIIFSLQRVRKIQPDLPVHIEKETQARLAEISRLLSSIAPGVQGINRYRYSRWMSGIEELIEALTFAHYLRTQSLMGYDDAVQQVAALSTPAAAADPDETMDVDVDVNAGDPPLPPPAAGGRGADSDSPPPAVHVHVTEQDYLMGIFDLSGEMMRFATIVAALSGSMAGGAAAGEERTIGRDMQELGSFFEMLPQQHDKGYSSKMSTLRQSVFKVEKLGYGLKVRGSERPTGWMPDTSDEVPDVDE